MVAGSSVLTYTPAMEIAVTIPDEIFHRAEEIAAALGLSRSELYVTALTEFMREQRDARLTECLNQVYDATDSSLDPSVQQLQAVSLPVEQW